MEFKPDRGVRITHVDGTDMTLMCSYLTKVRTQDGMDLEVATMNHGTLRFKTKDLIAYYEFQYSTPTTLWKNEQNLVTPT